jgi:hypothetical protein
VVESATNVTAVVHIRAATNTSAARAAAVEFTIAGRLFFTDWLQTGDSGGHDFDIGAGPDFTVREYFSDIVRGSSDDGNPLTLAEAESLADAMADGAAFHLDLLVGVSSDPGLTLAEMWLEVTWDESTWPLRVVSAAGDVYRVGPDSNPDGGVLRLVTADGTVYIQGAGSSGPGTQDVPPDSFSVLDVEDGARWSDDGPSSLHDIDGNKVYWNGSIGGAGVGDQWVEAAFGPITPAGATCTGIIVSQSIVTGAGGGKTTLCLADGTVINTNTSTAGNASTFSSTNIANIIANGALVRRYGTDASVFASPAFSLDRVILFLTFDDVDIPARPLRYVSSDGTVEVTLPMVLE